jgi:hypothetical protein
LKLRERGRVLDEVEEPQNHVQWSVDNFFSPGSAAVIAPTPPRGRKFD